jgi:erythromycin esterase-like protein
VGDSRATDLRTPGLGQIARERCGRLAVLVGFTSYRGTIVAAADQGLSPRRLDVGPAPANSVEALCHAVEIPRFVMGLRGASDRLLETLREPRVERMIDAVYQPGADNPAEYVRARLADQFDALIHFDETRSLEPLDTTF